MGRIQSDCVPVFFCAFHPALGGGGGAAAKDRRNGALRNLKPFSLLEHRTGWRTEPGEILTVEGKAQRASMAGSGCTT
jgi:hypothetical protein